MNGNLVCNSFSLAISYFKKNCLPLNISTAYTIKSWNAKKCYKLVAKNVFQSPQNLKTSQTEMKITVNANYYLCHG